MRIPLFNVVCVATVALTPGSWQLQGFFLIRTGLPCLLPPPRLLPIGMLEATDGTVCSMLLVPTVNMLLSKRLVVCL